MTRRIRIPAHLSAAIARPAARSDTSAHAAAEAVAAAALAVVVGAVLAATPARAGFDLQGKNATLLVGNGLGGGGDTYARTFTPYLSKYLPGKPTIVVKNMSGGGGLQAVQYLYNVAPHDGTTIGTTPGGPLKEPFIGTRKVNYDLRKFQWVGAMADEVTTCVVWHTSPAKTLDDALRTQVTLSSTGPASNANIIPQLLNRFLGTKFKTIAGYNGGTSLLAMERGEVEGRCLSIGALRAARPDWIAKNIIRPLVVMKKSDDPFFKAAPAAVDAIKDPANRQALLFFNASDEIQYPYMLPPGVPADAVAAWRKGFAAAMKDPQYLADARRRHQDPIPIPGPRSRT